MTWQPIETAPKDGTWIVLASRRWGAFPIAQWGPFGEDEEGAAVLLWAFRDEFLCVGEDHGFLGWAEDIEDGNMPTHWAPILEETKP